MDKSIEGLLPALLATNRNIAESDKLHTEQHVQLMELIRKTMLTPEWTALLLSLNDRLNEHDAMSDTMKVLVETLGSLRDHVIKLTETVNMSLQHSVKQQQTIEQLIQIIVDSNNNQQNTMDQMLATMSEMTNSFTENTARLNALTIAVQDATKDDGLGDVYKNIITTTTKKKKK